MSQLNAGTLNVTNTLKLPNYTTSGRNALSPSVGTMIFNTTDSIVEIWNGSEWAPAGGASETFIVASGGTITESGNYKIHTFNSSGANFTVSQIASDAANNNVEYLIVAGGGGGGGFGSGLNGNFGSAGGGGAGGLVHSGGYNFPVAVQTYTVNVGGGGTGGTGNGMGADGGGSQFGSISATGGGGGAQQDQNGRPGGSGGGNGTDGDGWNEPAGSGVPGQGYPGGRGGSSQNATSGWLELSINNFCASLIYHAIIASSLSGRDKYFL